MTFYANLPLLLLLSLLPTVDATELQALLKGFKEVDKDKSGDLDQDEFKVLMKTKMTSATTDDTIKVRMTHYDVVELMRTSWKQKSRQTGN